MKVLVTGFKGQLGFDVIKRLEELNIECKGVDIEDFDLLEENLVSDYIENYSPTVVVHCAAYTAVDKAEDNIDVCRAVNLKGTKNIAVVCKKLGIKLMYISTDYVFDGTGEAAFETDAKKAPLGIYGLTKLEGEEIVEQLIQKYFIVRISWVFGINGNNFIKTMLRLAKDRDELSIVADQIGSPTYTFDLARLLCDMIATEKYGTYHATNEGYCSWYEFACEIFKQAGVHIKVKPVSTEEYPTRAVRPKNSRLSKKSLDDAGFKRLPSWQDAVKRFLIELNQQ
jgi:dTDP-4-dehydrorhamnose reductase